MELSLWSSRGEDVLPQPEMMRGRMKEAERARLVTRPARRASTRALAWAL
jgi:hypothetical protein